MKNIKFSGWNNWLLFNEECGEIDILAWSFGTDNMCSWMAVGLCGLGFVIAKRKNNK